MLTLAFLWLFVYHISLRKLLCQLAFFALFPFVLDCWYIYLLAICLVPVATPKHITGCLAHKVHSFPFCTTAWSHDQ